MDIAKNFIVFEGIDGSGKGTQIELLKKHFMHLNRKDVVFTFEHTRNTEWSDKIEDILNSKALSVSMKDLQLLFILDRKEHLRNTIIPALNKGKIVISDRYFLSTLVYGSLDGSLHWKTLLDYHKQIIGKDFLIPNKTIFINVSSDIAISRINSSRNEATIFESREKLEKVVKSYLNIGKYFHGFEIVDGQRSSNDVSLDIRQLLENYL